ncbi:50S ribosomal protein L24 [Thiomicrorhabdus sp. 6S3-12]|uniref:50S ribosomal protein L24 n=1 Tax=Thiomicrorhabdus sp. 6S3-12 TaxID=2819681 RepID=UPI001AADF9EA|nr:50S ribosomal protein L24 [Thiomicrorhabdus sp. 6S3-12]MBO1923969.1 50S ribosomal protein L24 [Thiomicrorhabdus sp. 6S3-12]
MNRLRKGDEVIVLAGKDKGKRGSISSVMANGKVLVDGINLVKKHTKGNPMTGAQGGIVSKEMPIDASNVALVNPETNKADKVGFKVEGEKKVRFFKSTGKAVDA